MRSHAKACAAGLRASRAAAAPMRRPWATFGYGAVVALPALVSIASAQAHSQPKSAFDFHVPTAAGNNISFAEAVGDARVVLAVNVASACGLTQSNYAGLQDLHERFEGRPFTVLGFPANNFGGQEPGTDDEIQEFAASKGASFPILGKVNVTGDGTHPLWEWMSSQQSEGFGLASVLPGPRWNFHKVLLVDGRVKQHYAPTTAPSDIADDIDRALKAVEGERSE